MDSSSPPPPDHDPTLALVLNGFVTGARETVLVFGGGWLAGFVYWQVHVPTTTSPFERLGSVVVGGLIGGLGGLTLLVGLIWARLLGVMITLLRSNLLAAAAVLGAVAWEADLAMDVLARTPLHELPSQPAPTILVVVMLLGFGGALAVFATMVVVIGAWWVIRGSG
jgi:hypothetical protein